MRGARAMAVASLVAAAPAQAIEHVYAARTASGLLEYTNQPSPNAERVFVVPYASTTWARRRTVLRRARPVDGAIEGMIRVAAAAHRVEESLLHAIIEVESGFDPDARSSAGAVGLMQLMPDTARRYGVADRSDPAQNIDGGARYLRDLLAAFKGDLRLVLAAYNAGEGAVLRHGLRVPPYAETMSYVPAVLARYETHALSRRLAAVGARP